MSEYTATAAQLLPIAAERAGRGARLSEIVREFWQVHDLAEGLGEALRWLDDDSVDTHPITVRGAVILSVGDPAQGVPIRWRETDRDGNTSERDANLGSLRNPAVRAVYDAAKELAGKEVPCTLVVAYEPNDNGWETKDERGKTVRPSHFRRVARIARHRNVVGEEPDTTPHSSAERTEQRRPSEPERQARPIAKAPPAPPVEIPAQPALADAKPPPVVVDQRPLDHGFLEVVAKLTAEETHDLDAPLSKEVLDAYKLQWWNNLGRERTATLRQLNEEAKAAGRPHLRRLHDPETTGGLVIVGNLTRDLLEREGAPA